MFHSFYLSSFQEKKFSFYNLQKVIMSICQWTQTWADSGCFFIEVLIHFWRWLSASQFFPSILAVCSLEISHYSTSEDFCPLVQAYPSFSSFSTECGWSTSSESVTGSCISCPSSYVEILTAWDSQSFMSTYILFSFMRTGLLFNISMLVWLSVLVWGFVAYWNEMLYTTLHHNLFKLKVFCY